MLSLLRRSLACWEEWSTISAILSLFSLILWKLRVSLWILDWRRSKKRTKDLISSPPDWLTCPSRGLFPIFFRASSSAQDSRLLGWLSFIFLICPGIQDIEIRARRLSTPISGDTKYIEPKPNICYNTKLEDKSSIIQGKPDPNEKQPETNIGCHIDWRLKVLLHDTLWAFDSLDILRHHLLGHLPRKFCRFDRSQFPDIHG